MQEPGGAAYVPAGQVVHVDELANEYGDKVNIGKLNVDENAEIAAQLGVRNIPTILFFKNGEVVDKLVGMNSKSTLENKINSLI